MEQQPARRPDFGRLASHIRDISEEVQLFENIPALEGGAQLMRRMDQILEAITEMRREMRREMNVLSQKLTITDKNFKARMANSIVVSGEMTLSPLYNVTTGQEVSHCPETLTDLEQCDMDIAAAILREVGEGVPRAHEQRRRQLKLTFGIRTRAI